MKTRGNLRRPLPVFDVAISAHAGSPAPEYQILASARLFALCLYTLYLNPL